jgi:hypothetical protein
MGRSVTVRTALVATVVARAAADRAQGTRAARRVRSILGALMLGALALGAAGCSSAGGHAGKVGASRRPPAPTAPQATAPGRALLALFAKQSATVEESVTGPGVPPHYVLDGAASFATLRASLAFGPNGPVPGSSVVFTPTTAYLRSGPSGPFEQVTALELRSGAELALLDPVVDVALAESAAGQVADQGMQPGAVGAVHRYAYRAAPSALAALGASRGASLLSEAATWLMSTPRTSVAVTLDVARSGLPSALVISLTSPPPAAERLGTRPAGSRGTAGRTASGEAAPGAGAPGGFPSSLQVRLGFSAFGAPVSIETPPVAPPATPQAGGPAAP